METITAASLGEALRKAEAAHAEYEKTLGARDAGWSDWYARYILNYFGENHDRQGTDGRGVCQGEDCWSEAMHPVE